MKNKGITLIALVVTIIVLLILAGISINMLTGQNGILNRASEAKNKTGIAQIDEKVNISVADALTDGLGTITEDGLTKALDNNFGNGNYTLSKTGTDEWTIAVEDRKYRVNGSGSVIIGEAPKYSEDVDEKDIIRDLFLYEVSDENAKTAKIIGMNPKYCNNYKSSCIDYEWGYDSENNKIQIPMQYPDTNYDIKYYTDENRENITTISDTLVVPYDCEIDGKTYTINEADLNTYAYVGNKWQGGVPNVKTIIFPNTINKKISVSSLGSRATNATVQKVVLPEVECSFSGAMRCTGLKEINLENVTSLSSGAFSRCTSIKNITITEKTKNVGNAVFSDWTADQTINVPFKEGEKPSGWSDIWTYGCNAKINYLK